MLFRFGLLSLCSFLMWIGCVEINPSNPYDPDAPLSVQFKGKVKGVFRIQGEEFDERTESYKLQVLNAQNQPIMDNQGEILVYETRTQADLDELKSDDEFAVIGSFEIQLEMGVYSLFFDPQLNGKPSLSSATSPQIEVQPGQIYMMDLFVTKTSSFDEYDCLFNSDCDLGEECIEGYCVTNTNADRDRDGRPDLEDLCPEIPSEMHIDTDGDRQGNACDDDDDNDGVDDPIDNCPLVANSEQFNANQDRELEEERKGNACDNLVPGTSVKGRVVLPLGMGGSFSDVQVSLKIGDQETNLSTSLDETGSFIFNHALADQPLFSVRFELTGYESKTVLGVANLFSEVSDLGEIYLVRETGSLWGIALKEGTNEGGVRVSLAGTEYTTFSNLEGIWELNGVPVGEYTVSFTASHFETNSVDAVMVLDGEETEVAQQSLNPSLSASVSGSLLTSIENFDWGLNTTISLTSLRYPLSKSFAPSNDGSFSEDGLQPGLYQLGINAQGHISYSSVVEFGEEETVLDPIALVPIQESEEAVFLTGTVNLTGRSDHSGVQVRAFIDQQQQMSDLSAEDGSFSLRLSPLSHTITLSANSYRTQTLSVSWSDLRQQFETLINDQSIALSEATLTLDRLTNTSIIGQLSSTLSNYDWTTVVLHLEEIDGDTTRTFAPISDGSFTHLNLPPGLYILSVHAPGHSPTERVISLQSGENHLDEIPLTLIRDTDEAIVLTGQVRLEGQDDHSGSEVRVLIGQELQGATVTSSDGSFSLQLSPLPHYVVITKDAFTSIEVNVEWIEERGRFEFLLDGVNTDFLTHIFSMNLEQGENGDIDLDGIINVEDNCPTLINPTQIDTDEDGLGNVCDDDDDDDGLLDLTELQIGTNPLIADSDEDGLSDFVEHVQLRSSPTTSDTDGDGELDGDEVGSNPEEPLDYDGDGILDILESTLRDSDRDGAHDEIDGPADQGDLDGDGVINASDNCINLSNNQADLDGDLIGDACDLDDDGDGFEDAQDNCPRDANEVQADNDNDGVGDTCDDDDDGDGILDEEDPYPLFVDIDRDGVLDGNGDERLDNCPDVPNPDQFDRDGDGEGDACDEDDDNDGVLDVIDNCPLIANTNQLNSEPAPDSFGDACDNDDDNDGVDDVDDNCPFVGNLGQGDRDYDGLGNACDEDMDGDGVNNDEDNCPLIDNPGQQDADEDGIGNACSQDVDGDGVADGRDNCPQVDNADQRNQDGDQLGDACDEDMDGDGFNNDVDNCVILYNNPQLNLDGDQFGDACDLDDDNDGINDRDDACPRVVNVGRDEEPFGEEDNVDSACDNCPFASNEYQLDRDKDGIGDACDEDIDGDGLVNENDNCPRVANPNQVDTSGDGLGDACENNIIYYLSDKFNVSDTALWTSPTSPIGDRFWVALDGGGLVEHVRESDGSWTRVKQHTPTDGLPDRWIKHLAVDNAGNVYVITRKGLAIRYVNGVWEEEIYRSDIVDDCRTAWGYAEGHDVGNILMWKHAVDFDVDKTTGAIYAVFARRYGLNNELAPNYPSVLVRSDASELTCWPQGTGPLGAEFFSVDVSPDGEQLWIGTALGGSRYTESSGWTNFLDVQIGFSQVKQVGFEINSSGAGYDALLMDSDVSFSDFRATRILKTGEIDSIAQQIENYDYIYTESQSGSFGLGWQQILVQQSTIPAGPLKAIRINDGSIIIRSDTAGGVDGEERRFHIPTVEGTLVSSSDYADEGREVNAIARDENGEYWLGLNGGLYSSRDDFTYTTASGLHTNEITSVAINQGGVVWMGTPTGLARFQNGLFDRFSERKVNGIAVDSNNRIWVAQYDGFYEFDGSILAPVLDEDGTALCAIDWHYRDGPASALDVMMDGLGNVSVACRHKVFRLVNGVWTEYASIGVERLDWFSSGELWAGGGVGLFDDGGVLVRQDAGGSAFALRGSGSEGWVALYGGLALVDGVEGGTEGLEVGGEYRGRPCADSKPGCPELGFVEILGGNFTRHSRGGDLITVSNFEIMRTEVTYEMWRMCRESGWCPTYFPSPIPYEPQYGGADHPIHVINWFDSQRFAEWVGARLPTQVEWEWAARGGDRDVDYPWGDDSPNCNLASYDRCEPTKTHRVCSKLLGNSLNNLCDLGGNVQEWIQDERNIISSDNVLLDGSGWCNDIGCLIDNTNDSSRIIKGSGWRSSVIYQLDDFIRISSAPSSYYSVSLGLRLSR